MTSAFSVGRNGLDVPDQLRAQLAEERIAARLVQKDATLWGPDAESEAAVRLGWLDLPASSRQLVSRLADLRAELAGEGLDRIVLCGMGGSSLAPEVICATAGVPLVVLDTTDPGQVLGAMTDLERTVVVVSSKSGGTVETDSQRRAFISAFAAAGLDEKAIGGRFVVVTDPGSPLSETAAEMGARAVFLADPTVGGRYSALSAFGLVPSALAGADVGALLDAAEELAEHLAAPDNAALELGAALGAAFRAGRDKLALADGDSAITGFGDWAEQLIAESTGKEGRGILPVVLESADAPGSSADDVVLAVVGSGTPATQPSLGVDGSLGAQFLGWEYATAVAGRVLGINPFDQPNVTESKENTQRILAEGLPDEPARGDDRRDRGPRQRRGAGRGRPVLARRRDPRPRRAAELDPAARLPRRHGLPRPRAGGRRRRTCGPRSPAGPSTPSPSAGGRASCTPPASTTRADPRSARSCRSPARWRRTSRSPTRSSRSAPCRRPRPPGTGRPSPTAGGPSCTCT